ncbi:plastocyanin/azurin family copper-binding protein [Halobacteriaceae archaeon GCM10025711]
MKRRAFLAGAGAASAGLAGCLGMVGGESQRREFDVGMRSNAFLPDEFEIAVGETVTWLNTGSRRHTVTAYEARIPDGADYFASGGYESEMEARDAWISSFGGVINPGETYEHTFEVAGDHHYVCLPHEGVGMTGVIHVTDG